MDKEMPYNQTNFYLSTGPYSIDYLDTETARTCTLCAKVLQSLANFSEFGAKEQYMLPMNPLLISTFDKMRSFVSNISTPRKGEGRTFNLNITTHEAEFECNRLRLMMKNSVDISEVQSENQSSAFGDSTLIAAENGKSGIRSPSTCAIPLPKLEFLNIDIPSPFFLPPGQNETGSDDIFVGISKSNGIETFSAPSSSVEQTSKDSNFTVRSPATQPNLPEKNIRNEVCPACRKTIHSSSSVLIASTAAGTLTFHEECFTCAKCKRKKQNGELLWDGESLCCSNKIECNSEGKCRICYNCKKEIGTESHFQLQDSFWHSTCFKCEECSVDVIHDCRFENGRLLCPLHFATAKGYVCSACGLVIENEYIEMLSNIYHVECKKCKVCGIQFPRCSFLAETNVLWVQSRFAMNPLLEKISLC
jgi:hypothetical protein